MTKELEEHKKFTLISIGSLSGIAISSTAYLFFEPFPLLVISLWFVFIGSLYTNRAIIFN